MSPFPATDAPPVPGAVLDMAGRRIIRLTGASHLHKNMRTNMTNATANDPQRSVVEKRWFRIMFFCRIIPSIRATLPKRYPQNAVDERQKKRPHDSTELADIVPAPPKRKLMEVTINSARNKTPPELPRSYGTTFFFRVRNAACFKVSPLQ